MSPEDEVLKLDLEDGQDEVLNSLITITSANTKRRSRYKIQGVPILLYHYSESIRG
jgi:hypothetical protein